MRRICKVHRDVTAIGHHEGAGVERETDRLHRKRLGELIHDERAGLEGNDLDACIVLEKHQASNAIDDKRVPPQLGDPADWQRSENSPSSSVRPSEKAFLLVDPEQEHRSDDKEQEHAEHTDPLGVGIAQRAQERRSSKRGHLPGKGEESEELRLVLFGHKPTHERPTSRLVGSQEEANTDSGDPEPEAVRRECREQR